MVEFGPNGSVAPSTDAPVEASGDADYRVPTVTKFKRITLAGFLCGIAACLLVSLIGIACVFLGYQISDLFGQNADLMFNDNGFLQGIGIAAVISALNWYVAYFTVPAAWIAIALSLGRFPRRGIVQAMPYYKWGAIWGALLVGGTAGVVASGLADWGIYSAIGGGLAGGIIGGVAGFICGAIFRSVVRPAEQVRQIQVDVF